jgi:hypothetical protein
VTPSYEGAGFDLIITIGAQSLDSLGQIYASNLQIFANAKIINLDNQATNTNFGTVNLVDNTSSSLSEIAGMVIPALTLPVQGDIASNIMAGIYSATSDFTLGATAETFEVIAYAMRSGGQKPSSLPNTAPITPMTPVAETAPVQNMPSQSAPPAWAQAPDAQVSQPAGLDISPFLNPQNFSVSTEPQTDSQPQVQSQSSEEVPVGERAQTESPEADWLTPKIFKGKGMVG